MGNLTKPVRDFVNVTKLGFAATVCSDGTPNLSPKGTIMAWDEDHLVFADIHSPGTVENLKSNPSIEINVVDVFMRKGYRFKGTGSVYSAGPVFDEVVVSYRKAGSKHKINNIVRVKVDRILPLESPAYDSGLTEEEVKMRWIVYWKSVHESDAPEDVDKI